jgi:hypothetical protein
MPWPAWKPGDERKLVFGDQVTSVKLDPKRLDWFAAHPVATQPAPPRSGGPRD